MYSLHVVKQVPPAWEAISKDGAVTIRERTQMWLFAMAMHTVGFSLMSQKTRSGRKLQFSTGRDLAPVWLQMRIQVFARDRD